MEYVREVEHNFNKWGAGDAPEVEAQPKPQPDERELQPGFVEVDVNQHMGDSDAEMVQIVKEKLEEYLK